MQNMLASHSLTEAMHQRIADYSLEIRSVPRIMSHPSPFNHTINVSVARFFSP